MRFAASRMLPVGWRAHLLGPAPPGSAAPGAAVTILPAQAPAALAQAAPMPVAAAAALKEPPSAVGPGANSADPAPSSTASGPDPAITRPGPAAQQSPDSLAGTQNAEQRNKTAEPAPQAQPPARGRHARERFAATQEWLKTTPGNFYTIQLLTAKESELAGLEGFLLKAFKMGPREDFRVCS